MSILSFVRTSGKQQPSSIIVAMSKRGSFHRVSSSHLHELAHKPHEAAGTAATTTSLALHVHLKGHLGSRRDRVLL